MSPLLASLALLALCWQPSAGVSWSMESLNQKSDSFIPKDKQSQVGSAITSQAKVGGGEATLEKVAALLDLMPNTLLLVAYSETKVLDKIEFLYVPLANGVLCELDDPKLPEKLNAVAAGHPPTDKDKENFAAGLKMEYGFDCAASPPTSSPKMPNIPATVLAKMHHCFCVEQKFVYCAFAFIKYLILDEAAEVKVTKQPCRDVTVPALLNAGSGALGRQYDLENFGQNAINDAFSGNVDAFSNENMKNLLCDAVDPDVEAAVKAVYASDVIYWFTESLVYTAIFGPSETVEMSLAEYCELEAVKADEYGKCFCKANKGEGTGFTFCIYKVIAEYFVKEGYLTCDKADKTKQTFVAGRKPRAIPMMMNATAANSTAAQSSVGAPTGGAATSSLTIATLAAAALLLLRQ